MSTTAHATSDADPGARPIYQLHRFTSVPDLLGDWDGPAWGEVAPLAIASFHSAGSDHRPRTQAKAGYDDRGLYVQYLVEDRYVVARHVGYQVPVCKDSCVEFFVQPGEGNGYFNFEFNCGGAMLLNYSAPGVGETPVSQDWLERIEVATTLEAPIEPERTEPVTWRLGAFIPFALIEAYAGSLGDASPRPGVSWRANWYKCASWSSHPHYGAWSSIGETLGFHQVDRFGVMQFG